MLFRSARGLKGRFQQNRVRKHLGPYACPRIQSRFEIGPSGLKHQFLGVPQTQGCALGYRKSALQAWIANTCGARTKHTPQRPPRPTGFMGNDRGITRGLAIMASNRLPQSENSIFLGEMAWAIDRAEAQSTHGVGGVIRGS